jgi:hypothetical protein
MGGEETYKFAPNREYVKMLWRVQCNIKSQLSRCITWISSVRGNAYEKVGNGKTEKTIMFAV